MVISGSPHIETERERSVEGWWPEKANFERYGWLLIGGGTGGDQRKPTTPEIEHKCSISVVVGDCW